MVGQKAPLRALKMVGLKDASTVAPTVAPMAESKVDMTAV